MLYVVFLSLFALSTHSYAARLSRSTEGLLCVRSTNGAIRTVYSSRCPRGYTVLSLNLVILSGDSTDDGTVGNKGATGDRGAHGDRGPTGDKGASLFETLKPLTTVRGSVGGVYNSAKVISGNRPPFSLLQSFHATLGNALSDAEVIIANTSYTTRCAQGPSSCIAPEELALSSLCMGSVYAPTAPPGKVCVYPSILSNVINLSGKAVGKAGFELDWTSEPSSSEETEVQASWAYTAP